MKKKSSIILHSLFFVICSVLAVLFLYHIISIRRLNVKYTPAMTECQMRIFLLSHSSTVGGRVPKYVK